MFGIGEGVILPIITLSARSMGAFLAEAALIVTLIGIGSLVSSIPASMIKDKFGERRGMVGPTGSY